jgi:hypothetical protein
MSQSLQERLPFFVAHPVGAAQVQHITEGRACR